MKVPFLDLGPQHEALRAEIFAAWAEIYDSTRFVSGPSVAAFEEDFAGAHDADHCVAVANGTDALMLGLRALGVRPGDQVVVPANTFIATAEAVSHVGAVPRFVDVDPVTKNIDVAAAAAALADDEVVGVLPVHLYGQPADLDPLVAAADSHQKWVMEDAAQAHLARYRRRSVGTLGRAAAFSFYPGKNLGATGEGGAILTNDAAMAEHARALRDHGQTEKYHSRYIGYNARMHEMVGAALSVKLRRLEEWTEKRRRVAAWYEEALGGAGGVELPVEPDWARSVYHLYVVHVADRDRVRDTLDAMGIATGLHYPVPIHLQPAYRDLGLPDGSFPVAERSADRLLSLPMYPELPRDAVEYVAEALVRTTSGAGGPS